MRIEQLEYVLAVAQYGSLSKASANIFIGQPTLSTAIASLEKELGHPLFRRTRRGMELTELGHDLLPLIEKTVEDFYSIKKKAGVQAPGKVHMQLLAAGPTMPVLATAVARNRSIFPSVHYILHQQQPSKLLEDLARKRAFLGLSFSFDDDLLRHRKNAEDRKLRLVPFYNDRLVLFAKGDGQFKDAGCIDFKDLNDPSLNLALPLDILHYGLSSTPSSWSSIPSATAYDCRLQLKCHVRDYDGIGLTSLLATQLDSDFDHNAYRIIEVNGTNSSLVHYMSYRKDRTMNEAEADLIQQVENYYSYLMV